jgi:hypothetical protein
MAAAPTLIYCGGNNKRFAQIALDAGYEYGARLPGVINYRLYFADQDWKRPNRAAYMRSLAVHRPVMATVLDWERSEQLGEVLDWGEEASRFVDQIVIIPKVINEVWRLPRYIGGKRVVLAYSVPTAYGGTQVPSWDFAGWPVHILGGTPHKQMEVYRYLRHTCEIVSVDGNSPQKLAMLTCFSNHPTGASAGEGDTRE